MENEKKSILQLHFQVSKNCRKMHLCSFERVKQILKYIQIKYEQQELYSMFKGAFKLFQ